MPLCPFLTWLHITICVHVYIWKVVWWCKILHGKEHGLGASGIAGSRCSDYVTRNLSVTISWLCFPPHWLHSVASSHVMVPNGSGIVSCQFGSLSRQRAPLSRKSQQLSMDQMVTCVLLEQVRSGKQDFSLATWATCSSISLTRVKGTEGRRVTVTN